MYHPVVKRGVEAITGDLLVRDRRARRRRGHAPRRGGGGGPAAVGNYLLVQLPRGAARGVATAGRARGGRAARAARRRPCPARPLDRRVGRGRGRGAGRDLARDRGAPRRSGGARARGRPPAGPPRRGGALARHPPRLAELGLRAAGSDEPAADAPIVVATLSGFVLAQLSLPNPAFEDEVLRPALSGSSPAWWQGPRRPYEAASPRGGTSRRAGRAAAARLSRVVLHVASPHAGAEPARLALGRPRPRRLRRLAGTAAHLGAPRAVDRGLPQRARARARSPGGARLGRSDRALVGVRAPGGGDRPRDQRLGVLPRRALARARRGRADSPGPARRWWRG